MKHWKYLDVARGIGLLLVIISHSCGLSPYLINYYIPLFFVVSGYLYKPGRSYGENMAHKAKRLLVIIDAELQRIERHGVFRRDRHHGLPLRLRLHRVHGQGHLALGKGSGGNHHEYQTRQKRRRAGGGPCRVKNSLHKVASLPRSVYDIRSMYTW